VQQQQRWWWWWLVLSRVGCRLHWNLLQLLASDCDVASHKSSLE
jgi:hypothetical protein